jgi:hypothetical protein
VPRKHVIKFAPDVHARIFEPDMEEEPEQKSETSSDYENLDSQKLLDNKAKKKYKDILIERKHLNGDIEQPKEISNYIRKLEEEESVKIDDNPLEGNTEMKEKDIEDKKFVAPTEHLNNGNIDFPVRGILKKNEKWAKKLEKQKEDEMKILVNCEKVDMKRLKKQVMSILDKHAYLKEYLEDPSELSDYISEMDTNISERKKEINYWADEDEDDGTATKEKEEVVVVVRLGRDYLFRECAKTHNCP